MTATAPYKVERYKIFLAALSKMSTEDTIKKMISLLGLKLNTSEIKISNVTDLADSTNKIYWYIIEELFYKTLKIERQLNPYDKDAKLVDIYKIASAVEFSVALAEPVQFLTEEIDSEELDYFRTQINCFIGYEVAQIFLQAWRPDIPTDKTPISSYFIKEKNKPSIFSIVTDSTENIDPRPNSLTRSHEHIRVLALSLKSNSVTVIQNSTWWRAILHACHIQSEISS